MTDVEVVALSRTVHADAARDAAGRLAPGNHRVDMTVRITGVIKRGQDYEQRIVGKADPWRLLAAALSHLSGATIDSIVRESLSVDGAQLGRMRAEADAAIARLTAPTVTRCNGRITAALDIVEVGEPVVGTCVREKLAVA